MLVLAFAALLTQGEGAVRYVVATPLAQVNSLPALSADGKWAATLDTHGQGLIYSIDRQGKGSVVQGFRVPASYRDAVNFTNYQDMRGMLSLSPRGRYLAVGDADGKRSQVYQISPWKQILEFDNVGYTHSADWSPDESRLLCNTVSADQRGQFTRVVRIADGSSVKVPVSGPFAFPAGGKTAIGLARSGLVEFNLSTGRAQRAFTDSVETMAPVALSPSGKYLVTGGEDPAWHGPDIGPNDPAPSEAAYAHQTKFKIWRMSDGKRISLLPGPFSGSGANPADPLFLGEDRVAFLTTGGMYRLSTGKKVSSLPEADYGRTPMLPPATEKPLSPRPLTLPPALQPPKLLGASKGRILFGFPSARGRLAVLDSSARRWTFVDAPGFHSIERVVWRADGKAVLAGGGRLGMLASDLGSVRALSIPKVAPSADFGIPSSLRVSPDGTQATLAPLGPGKAVTWRIDDGKVVSKEDRTGASLGVPRSAPGGLTYTGAIGPRSGIQFNPPSGKSWSFVPQHYFGTVPHFDAKGERVVFTEWISQEMDEREQWLDVFQTSDGKSLAKVKIPSAGDVALSGDGQRVAIARPSGIEVREFPELNAGRLIEVPMPQSPQLEFVQTADGERLVLYGYGAPISIFDGSGALRAQLAAWDDGAWAAWTPTGALEGNTGGLARMRISRAASLEKASRERPEEVWAAFGAKAG